MIRTRTPFRHTALAAVAVAALTLTACGGDDSASSGDDTETAVDDTTSVLPDDTDASDVTLDGSTDNEPDVTNPSSAEDGTCNVDVTGDVTTSFTATGGVSAVNTDYWLTPEQKEMFGDSFYFIINCQGDAGYLGILAGGNANEDSVPYGPATYTLTPNGGLIGGAGEDSTLAILFTIEGDDGVWGISEPGTVAITEFDDSHIAGTVQFTAMDTIAEMTGTPERSISVTSSFDFANPN